MAQLIRVTDPADERLADYAALTDAELRKRYEHRHGVLIAEGPNPVRALAASRYPLRSLLLSDERVEAVRDVLDATDAPAYLVTRALLEEVVRFPLHQGVVACGGRLPPTDPAEAVRGAARVVVLESVNDHENLGVLFRAARALGVGGVLLGPGCADPLYRRTVRVSMGHVLHVPFARVDALAAVFALLDREGFTTLALTPDARAIDLDGVEVADDQRVALFVGAEGPGLSGEALSGTQARVRIPMAAGVDSLNVAVAAAIAFHALRPGRRRR